MDRRDVQRRLVASETFCFSGARDFPKVYETLTRHHADPDSSQTFAVNSSLGLSYGAVDPEAGYRVSLDLATGEVEVAQYPPR
jgi:hypothetical protein